MPESLKVAELHPRPAIPATKFIHANGLQFGYLEAGEGPLVLCLHGFPDTAYNLVPLLHRLANAGYHAVAPFQRGYAPTDLPHDRDYSALALGRDVIALIEHFGVARASLVGHDWGAIAVYAAANLRADRIDRIVTAGVPHLRRYVLRPSVAQLAASHYIFKFQLPFWPERELPKHNFAWLRELVASWSPGADFAPEIFAPVWASFSDPDRLRAALGYYRALPGTLVRGDTWRFLMKPMQVPVRQICGERDGCMLAETFEGSAHLFAAGGELIRMPTGHFMHIEQPERFADHVLDFLRGDD